MKKTAAFCTLFLLSLTAMANPGQGQQDKKQRPSPPANAMCKFADGKTITVDYSSPRMRGRKIFGDLVPYGEVWRAGANEATTFVTEYGPDCWRERRARRELYLVHSPHPRQVDVDYQQENRRVGNPLSRRTSSTSPAWT